MSLRRLLPFLAGLLSALPLACLLTLVLNWPTRQPVFESIQPDTVSYQSFDPYKLVVIEGPMIWTTIPWSRHYQLFIGRATDAEETYGYRTSISFHPTSSDLATHIQQSRVEWDTNGVTFVEASGQRVSIPKELFIGGR